MVALNGQGLLKADEMYKDMAKITAVALAEAHLAIEAKLSGPITEHMAGIKAGILIMAARQATVAVARRDTSGLMNGFKRIFANDLHTTRMLTHPIYRFGVTTVK